MLEWLGPLSTIIIGLYAGSLLTEGAILVPYWRKMPAEEFFRLHKDVGPSLFRYFAPLTSAAVVLAVLVAVLAPDGMMLRWIAAALCLSALGIFFLYFQKANAGFANHSLSSDALKIELGRWAAWHHLRTVLIIGAFGCSTFAGM